MKFINVLQTTKNACSPPMPPKLLSVAPQLVAAVRSAHTARREAQALLAKDHRAVKIAIEVSEAAALASIQQGRP